MSNFIPIRKYNGNQVILTSDRVVINAKDNNVFIVAKKDLAISVGGDVHINVGPSSGGSGVYLLNAPRIQLGLGSVQPIPKGDDLTDMLNKLLSALSNLASSLISATGIGVGTVNEPSINMAGAKLAGDISNLTALVKKINSTVTFTK